MRKLDRLGNLVPSPICFVRRDLRIESRYVGITPGELKSGEKWRFFDEIPADVHS